MTATTSDNPASKHKIIQNVINGLLHVCCVLKLRQKFVECKLQQNLEPPGEMKIVFLENWSLENQGWKLTGVRLRE